MLAKVILPVLAAGQGARRRMTAQDAYLESKVVILSSSRGDGFARPVSFDRLRVLADFRVSADLFPPQCNRSNEENL